MYLEWSEHCEDIVSGVSGLFSRQKLLDITLAAKDGHLRAHKLILASVSRYFEDVLVNSGEKRDTIIFFRDNTFSELQSCQTRVKPAFRHQLVM